MYFETEEEIRRRITRRYRRWMWFFVQFFLTIPVGLFLAYAFPRPFNNFFLAIWFASLFIHGLVLFIDTIKEWAIRREIERQQRLGATFDRKPKRGGRLTLGEDGELLDELVGPEDFVREQGSKDRSV